MYKIIVDSTFGLEKEFIEKYDIKVVSLKLNLDNNIFDEANLEEWDLLYENMLKVKDFPKTSQPSPQDFEQAINEVLASDKDAKIIILTLSHKLSGTYNCAKLCAGLYPNNEIIVIDTLLTTIVAKLAVEEVVKLNQEGKSAKEIEDFITKFRNSLNVLIMPKDLIYLNRGGRLSNLSYAVASAISIKPLITLVDGQLKSLKNVIGVKKALMEFARLAKTPNSTTHLVEVYNSPYLDELASMFKSMDIEVARIHKMDPVIGCHVGPGGIAMAVIEN